MDETRPLPVVPRMKVSDKTKRPPWHPCAVATTCLILATALLPCGCQSSSGAAARGGGGGDGGEGEPEPPDTPTPDDTVAREIEEADIVKYRDGFFYLANRYRGLRIIDARTIERPAIVGGVAMKGRGVELYADEGQAVVVSSADYFSCGGLPVSFEDETIAKDLLLPDYSGSRITAVDVTDPADPVEISHFDMDGFIVATRRVGEVIYAVGNFDGSAGSIDDNDGDPVGDDGGTAPPLADPPPPSSTGAAANVNDAGQAVATATSPGGLPAEFSVAEAEPGGFIQVKAADGNLWTTLDGLPDAQLLSGTVSVSTDLEDGAFRGVVGVWPDGDAMASAELTADDLAMYRLDEALGLWVPAATNPVGSAVPTTVVGDFGYTDQTDEGDLAVWAIVDRVGDFAVGRRFADDLTINVVTSTGGTISVAPDQATYAAGTIITLMAVPDEGYHFVEWSAGPPAALDDAPNSPTIEFVLTTDTQVGATFALDTPDITGPRVFVVSINIADPAAIQIVDRVDVAGESLDIQVTENAIYVLGDDPTMADTTRINYVDISDPDGDVALRDTFRVPGKVEDRFFADEYDGVLRIITEDRSLSPWDPVVALYLYDVGDPDDVERIGQLTIETGESLRSVRFDGTRGYAVTFRQIDPLFVLDLSDPANPEVTGELLVPGWSTHLVPLGDRLVGVGFDDTRGFRPAVSLYDVSDPANPWERNRIILGEKWTFDTTSEATVDEKALKVLEDEGLILIPYSSYDAEQGRFVDSLQMIDLGSDWLTERGFIEHRGLVRRAGVADARLWVLSDEAFQVADIADRDDAIPLAAVDIMSEQELLDAGLTDCADSARFRGFDEIGFVPIDGEPIILTGEGLCGNVGMIGLMALPLSLALLHQIRRPGRWPHRARRATP